MYSFGQLPAAQDPHVESIVPEPVHAAEQLVLEHDELHMQEYRSCMRTRDWLQGVPVETPPRNCAHVMQSGAPPTLLVLTVVLPPKPPWPVVGSAWAAGRYYVEDRILSFTVSGVARGDLAHRGATDGIC